MGAAGPFFRRLQQAPVGSAAGAMCSEASTILTRVAGARVPKMHVSHLYFTFVTQPGPLRGSKPVLSPRMVSGTIPRYLGWCWVHVRGTKHSTGEQGGNESRGCLRDPVLPWNSYSPFCTVCLVLRAVVAGPASSSLSLQSPVQQRCRSCWG